MTYIFIGTRHSITMALKVIQASILVVILVAVVDNTFAEVTIPVFIVIQVCKCSKVVR